MKWITMYKSLGAQFWLTIEKELQTRYGQQLTPVTRSAITSVLYSEVAEELFFDLFAVRQPWQRSQPKEEKINNLQTILMEGDSPSPIFSRDSDPITIKKE